MGGFATETPAQLQLNTKLKYVICEFVYQCRRLLLKSRLNCNKSTCEAVNCVLISKTYASVLFLSAVVKLLLNYSFLEIVV